MPYPWYSASSRLQPATGGKQQHSRNIPNKSRLVLSSVYAGKLEWAVIIILGVLLLAGLAAPHLRHGSIYDPVPDVLDLHQAGKYPVE
jgi:hypothetical protein